MQQHYTYDEDGRIIWPFARIGGSIFRYDILVIGHLKWNPYFQESAAAPPRGDPSTCTSTLVRGQDERGEPFNLIIDPTLRTSAKDYYFDLNRRTGLQPEDVTHCFVTHSHFDHQAGLNYFPQARWLAAGPVAAALAHSEHIPGNRVEPVSGEFLPGLLALPLPGHQADLHGIAFQYQGCNIVAAADAVMTGDHFQAGTCMFEQDSQQAARTINYLKQISDLVIPGHDNLLIGSRIAERTTC